ncbi:hypothetical protein [Hymenobacter antarcticus]|uniref:Uncharacterized protein n=1 Tax=Hymenobacter antarcticus TaxID=486270 RepID=A0ABP7R4D6_9BACT
MKKDISFDPVEGVSVAVIPDEQALTPEGQSIWQVYLLNHNPFPLQNVIINANGYGLQSDGEKVRTTTLRFLFEEVPPHTAVPVEPLDSTLFHLNNQYWVSYYRGDQVFDKKFIFVPDSIVADNFTHIALLDKIGVLHS